MEIMIFLVMSFLLTNTLESFMELMNCIFSCYLYSFMIAFINAIFVYSRSMEEHEQYLRIVRHALRYYRFFAKISKCEFYLESMTFLGLIVYEDGIMVYLIKIETFCD